MGSGGEHPLDLHPSSLQAGPLSSLVKLWPQSRVGFHQEGRGWGIGPFGTVLVALFGDFLPSPEGRDGMGKKAVLLHPLFFFCPLLGRVRFACFFLLGCWCTAPLRPLLRAL